MEKVVFKVGKFTDFKGIIREVIFCAVSEELTSGEYVRDYELDPDVEKVLKLGVSVRNSEDSYNEQLGKQIAYGKAKKEKSCIGKLYSTQKGMINTKMVEALLEQELYYFKNNPGKYIKGYDTQKKKFESKK